MSVSRQPTITENSFKALAEDDDTELDGEALDALNGWAHKVNRSSRRLSKRARAPTNLDTFDRVTIRSERDLDAVLQASPKLAAIPDSAWTCGKKMRNMSRTKKIELECGPDEVLCRVDSGSSINAAWVEKQFPQYANHERKL